MKLVEFTRDFRPHRAGEARVVPDAVAERLIASGDAKPRDSVFDRKAEPPAAGFAGNLNDGAERARGKPYPTRKRR